MSDGNFRVTVLSTSVRRKQPESLRLVIGGDRAATLAGRIGPEFAENAAGNGRADDFVAIGDRPAAAIDNFSSHLICRIDGRSRAAVGTRVGNLSIVNFHEGGHRAKVSDDGNRAMGDFQGVEGKCDGGAGARGGMDDFNDVAEELGAGADFDAGAERNVLHDPRGDYLAGPGFHRERRVEGDGKHRAGGNVGEKARGKRKRQDGEKEGRFHERLQSTRAEYRAGARATLAGQLRQKVF